MLGTINTMYVNFTMYYIKLQTYVYIGQFHRRLKFVGHIYTEIYLWTGICRQLSPKASYLRDNDLGKINTSIFLLSQLTAWNNSLG